jgi:hypothetical protein
VTYMLTRQVGVSASRADLQLEPAT